jgi:hypothetical protein
MMTDEREVETDVLILHHCCCLAVFQLFGWREEADVDDR